MSSKKMGIYIHIPFCIRKCPYCGFFSRPLVDVEELNAYKQRLIKEMDSFANEYSEYVTKRQVDSIFFGGGTPSLMPPEYIERIISKIKKAFNVSQDCEITLEANPGTFSMDLKDAEALKGVDRTDTTDNRNTSVERLKEYLNTGVNRLSIGIQSFDDEILKTLGRIHNGEEAGLTFLAAREAGFDNINIDLMFGIPGQTMEKWHDTLRKVIELNPDHISFYSLQIEEGTQYHKNFMAGEFDELPDDVERDMYHVAIRELESAGYRHYEISNAAKPGFECRHNLKYWTGEEYVGFGDSAASYIDGIRYTMMNGEKMDIHVNSSFDDMSEYVFTGLRLRRGVSYGAFQSRFGTNLQEAFADNWNELDEFFKNGDLERRVSADGEPMQLVITEKGIDISNKIMSVFV